MKRREASKGKAEQASAENRFQVELDLHLFFTPLMQGNRGGVIHTRTLDLPFPPSTKIMVGGRSIEGD